MNLFDRIKPYISARRYSLLFVAVSVLCMFALLAYLRLSLLPGWRRLVLSLVDALLITIPYWFIKGRWRWTLLICTSLLNLFVIIAIYYGRVFHELIPIRMFTLTENFGGLLIKSWIGLVRWTDIIFLVLIAFPFFIYFIFRNKIRTEPGFTSPQRWIVITPVLLSFLIIQLNYFYIQYRYLELLVGEAKVWSVLCITYLSSFNEGVDKTLYQMDGLLVHTVFDIYYELSLPDLPITLDDTDKGKINSFLTNKLSDFSVNDTININNRSKNVILVIVESLNAEVIGLKINNNEVTPTLNRLIADSTTFSAINVIPQVKNGSSGDGQLIYNAGLLPLDDLIVTKTLGNANTYPSLVEQLVRDQNICILPDDGKVWSEYIMMKAYGYDTVFTEDDFIDARWKYGVDASVFRFALSQVKQAQRPFVLQLITCSMHVPCDEFTRNEYVNLFDSPLYAEMTRDYYASTRYFDTELGRFIDGLKAAGIWDNTILLIASDHDQSLVIGNKELYREHCNPIVFIAANTGHGGTIDHVVGQVDVFPTVLQLCGHDPSISYTGVGRSMLDGHAGAYDMWTKEVIGTTDSAQIASLKKSFEISDLIIRGNYFGDK